MALAGTLFRSLCRPSIATPRLTTLHPSLRPFSATSLSKSAKLPPDPFSLPAPGQEKFAEPVFRRPKPASGIEAVYSNPQYVERERAAQLSLQSQVSPDDLWAYASRPFHQPHNGPLTVASARVVYTKRDDAPNRWGRADQAGLSRFMGQEATVEELERAWRRLSMIVARAGLRRQANLTKRYEKPTTKRRRLKMERWRRIFANEVGRRVKMVNTMRMRGL